MKEVKLWHELTDKQRDKQNTKTMLQALFIIAPTIFFCFFIAGFIASFIAERMSYESLLAFSTIFIFIIVGYFMFLIIRKLFNKLGIKY